MPVDLETLPLIDLGLACKGCGYPLVGVSRWQCPECGREFDLDQYIPEGYMPPLYADGREVRASPKVVELLQTYRIPFSEVNSHFAGLYGGIGMAALSDRRGKPICVPRERYFETIDLLRRQKFDEPMPAPPPAPSEAELAQTQWTCAQCGESNPATFAICWNCMNPRANEHDQ